MGVSTREESVAMERSAVDDKGGDGDGNGGGCAAGGVGLFLTEVGRVGEVPGLGRVRGPGCWDGPE